MKKKKKRKAEKRGKMGGWKKGKRNDGQQDQFVLGTQLVLWLIWCDVASENMPTYINWKSTERGRKTFDLNGAV